MKTLRFSLLSIVLLLASCACAQARSEAEMNELGAALIKVSSAVESTVYYKKQGADLPEDRLLLFSTQHDPGLLGPFTDYALRVKLQGGHSAVLVCTPDGRIALLEDAGCTARLERHHWQARPALPCEFTLNLDELCRK